METDWGAAPITQATAAVALSGLVRLQWSREGRGTSNLPNRAYRFLEGSVVIFGAGELVKRSCEPADPPRNLTPIGSVTEGGCVFEDSRERSIPNPNFRSQFPILPCAVPQRRLGGFSPLRDETEVYLEPGGGRCAGRRTLYGSGVWRATGCRSHGFVLESGTIRLAGAANAVTREGL